MSTALQIYSFELYSCVPWWTAWFLTDSVMQMLASLRTQPRPDLNLKSPSFRASARTIERVSMRNGACFFRQGPKRKRKLCSSEGARERGSEILQSKLYATFPSSLDHRWGVFKDFLSEFKEDLEFFFSLFNKSNNDLFLFHDEYIFTRFKLFSNNSE